MNFPKDISDFLGEREYISDTVGMSSSKVLIFSDCVLKISPVSSNIENEYSVLKYFEDKLPIPKIINYIENDGLSYMLMSKMHGKMACSDEYMQNPDVLFSCIKDSLTLLWNYDISDCKIAGNLEKRLFEAEYRVSHNFVDIDDAEPDTFGKDGFKDPEELLFWLYDNRPKEDLVLSHGDFCLPNIFIDGDKFSGFVDVGKMAVADRYQDIALCYRSLKHNFSGIFGGKSYGDFDSDDFFKTIGIEPDWDKIRYYILLDELF